MESERTDSEGKRYNVKMLENSTNCIEYLITEHLDLVYVLFMANIFSSVMGTFGNILVVVAVFTSAKMTSSFHYFITSLAIADFLICGVDQPLLAALLYGRIHSECMRELFFAFRVVGNFACAISLLMLGLISIDRCLFVIRACGLYKNSMTKGKLVALLVVWTLAITYSALRMKINKKITSYMTVVAFVVCYLIIIVSYIVIYVQVRKHCRKRAVREIHTRNDERNIAIEQVASRKERQFANTIILVVFVFSAAWAYLFYRRMMYPEKDYGIWYNLGRTIALSSSACNPLLYCFMNSEYRRAFKRVLSKFSNGRKGYEKLK